LERSGKKGAGKRKRVAVEWSEAAATVATGWTKRTPPICVSTQAQAKLKPSASIVTVARFGSVRLSPKASQQMKALDNELTYAQSFNQRAFKFSNGWACGMVR
jgi:hypothetical protein